MKIGNEKKKSVLVEDLSRNGTFVNGAVVGTKKVLFHSFKIHLFPFSLFFCVPKNPQISIYSNKIFLFPLKTF